MDQVENEGGMPEGEKMDARYTLSGMTDFFPSSPPVVSGDLSKIRADGYLMTNVGHDGRKWMGDHNCRE